MTTQTSPLEVLSAGTQARPSAPSAESMLPIAGAAVMAALVVASSGSGRLPNSFWAAAFLFFAVRSDLRELRIPNLLNYGSLVLACALAWSGLGVGTPSLGEALAGTGVAFALLFPAFALGGMGAGDVKAAMVLGAAFGTSALLGSLWWSLIGMGVFAIGLILGRGEARELANRWLAALGLLMSGTRPTLTSLRSPSAHTGLPFAPALAFGCAAYGFWGTPWL